MREVEFGILVKAKAATKAGFDEAKSGATSMGKGIREAATRAQAGLKALGGAVVALNQGFELGMRAVHGLSRAFDMTVGKTLEQRKATDVQRRAWEHMILQLERIQGLVGDIVLPLLLGIGDAFKPVLDSTEKWLGQNRELTAGKMIPWLMDVAKSLVSGIATGIVVVTRVWSGWKQIVAVTQMLVAKGFEAILSGIEFVMGGFEKLAEAFGQGDLAAGIAATRKEVGLLGSTFGDSADEALAAAAQEARAQEALERQIADLEKRLDVGIGQAGVAAFARLKQAIQKIDLTHTKEELERLAEAAKKATARNIEDIATHFRKVQEMYLRRADAAERQAQLEQDLDERTNDLFESRVENIKDLMTEAFSSIRSVATDAFDDIGETVDGHTKTMGDAFKQLFSGLGKMVLDAAANFLIAKGIETAAEEVATIFKIKAAAAEGGSKAIAAHAGIPFVGLAIGLAAAAAIVGAILAYAGAFHSGGLIPGMPGEEKLALVKSRELVVDEQKTPAAIAAGFGPGGTPHAVAGGGGGGGKTVRIETLPPTRVTVDNQDRLYLGPARARRRRLGAEV